MMKHLFSHRVLARFWRERIRTSTADFSHFEKSGFWNEEAYLSFHPDVALAVKKGAHRSGWAHYCRHGRSEGRKIWTPADWDDVQYLEKYPTAKRAVAAGLFLSGYHHYKVIGESEGRGPASRRPRLWDENGYLRLHRDVGSFVAEGLFRDGLHHYEAVGRSEGRELPRPGDWDEHFYLAMYPAIADGVRSGYHRSGFEHFLFHGEAEGRKRAEKQPQAWDELSYLELHEDVSAQVKEGVYKSGWEHYQIKGKAEGRSLGLPKAVSAHLRRAAVTDPDLFPNEAFLKRLQRFEAMRRSPVGGIYTHFLGHAEGVHAQHVLLLPWMRAGGADKVALYHAEAIYEATGIKPFVFITENVSLDIEDRFMFDRLSICAIVYRMPPEFFDLNWDERKSLFVRMLFSLRNGQILHIVNSNLGWQTICEYGIAIKSRYRIFISAFAFGYSAAGEPNGYLRSAAHAAPYVAKFITDNQRIITLLAEMYGLDDAQFACVQYPVLAHPRFLYQGGKKVLWASRIDREKRPDILLAIAKRCPEITFHVYGGSLLSYEDEGKVVQSLSELPNAKLHGPFEGFDSIPTDDYMALLYTTESDGLPNIILEAHSSGLPVLAPDIGGIPEVIPQESGFLIARHDDVDAYAAFLRSVSTDRLSAERDRALTAIIRDRSWSTFLSRLSEIEGYVKNTGEAGRERSETKTLSPHRHGEDRHKRSSKALRRQ